MARRKGYSKDRYRKFDNVTIDAYEEELSRIPDKIYSSGTTVYKDTHHYRDNRVSAFADDNRRNDRRHVDSRTIRQRKGIKRKVIQVERDRNRRNKSWTDINIILASLTPQLGVGRLVKRARARKRCENAKAARRNVALRSKGKGTYKGNRMRKHRC